MEDMEKNNENLLAGAQSELRKEMAMLQKKIMMDTVSISTVFLRGGRKSVQKKKKKSQEKNNLRFS